MQRIEIIYNNREFTLSYKSKQVNDYTSYQIRVEDSYLRGLGDSVYVFLIYQSPSINPYFMPEVFRFKNPELRWTIKKALAVNLGIPCYAEMDHNVNQGLPEIESKSM